MRVRRLVPLADDDAIIAGYRFRLQPQVIPARQEQEAPLGTRMLDRQAHERIDRSFQHHLAGDCLRHLDHGREVEMLDRCLDRARWTRRALLLTQPRMELIELPHLSVGAPPDVATPRVSQVDMRDLVEAARGVKAGGKLVGERFVVHKAICARCRDGALVQVHGIEWAAVQAGDLSADQRRAVREIVRAALRKDLELTVTAGHRLEVLSAVAFVVEVAASGVRKRGEKTMFRPREFCRLGPEQLLRVGGGLEGRCVVARKEARLQLSDPPPASRKALTCGTRELALELPFVEIPVIEAAERARKTTERADEPEMRLGRVDHKPETGTLRELEVKLGFALHLRQWIARGEKIGDENARAVHSVTEIADLVGNRESAAQQVSAGAEVLRPRQDTAPEPTVGSGQ